MGHLTPMCKRPKQYANGLLLAYVRLDITTLTPHEDLQFAEVCLIVDLELQNDVSACRHVAGTLEVDGGTQRHITGVFATHVVVPQGRRGDVGRGVRQTDNEVVRAERVRLPYGTTHLLPASDVQAEKKSR